MRFVDRRLEPLKLFRPLAGLQLSNLLKVRLELGRRLVVAKFCDARVDAANHIALTKELPLLRRELGDGTAYFRSDHGALVRQDRADQPDRRRRLAFDHRANRDIGRAASGLCRAPLRARQEHEDRDRRRIAVCGEFAHCSQRTPQAARSTGTCTPTAILRHPEQKTIDHPRIQIRALSASDGSSDGSSVITREDRRSRLGLAEPTAPAIFSKCLKYGVELAIVLRLQACLLAIR